MYRYIILFLFLIINIVLLVLNQNVFTKYFELDLGFGSYNVLIMIILPVIGFTSLIVLLLVEYIKDLKISINESKLNNKILSLEKEVIKLQSDYSKLERDNYKSKSLNTNNEEKIKTKEENEKL